MTTIYVVMGSHGTYSDRCEWPVVAYADETRAKEHVILVNQSLARFQALGQDECERLSGPEWRFKNPLDPTHGFYPYDDHDRYWLDIVELLEEVPTL